MNKTYCTKCGKEVFNSAHTCNQENAIEYMNRKRLEQKNNKNPMNKTEKTIYNKTYKIGLLKNIMIGEYRVRVYKNRLAICRHDKKDLTWSEAQEVKEKILGDVFCIELYPRASKVVNKWPTKHLWLADESKFKEFTHEEFNLKDS